MPRPALRIEVSKKDQAALKKLLRGGIEQFRVAMRAVALLRARRRNGRAADRRSPAPDAASRAQSRPALSARRPRTGALRQAAARCGKLACGQTTPAHHRHGLQRSAAAAAPAGRCGWWPKKLSSEDWSRASARETIRILLLSHDLKPWRKKNVVRSSELDEAYIAGMEDVLENL